MKLRLILMLAMLGFAVPVAAQSPGAFSSLQVTSTSTSAVTIGCALTIRTGCTGGLVAGTGQFTTALATDGAALPTHGLAMASAVPSSTTFVLYNDSGTLKWNGIALAAGSSVSGTLNAIPRFTASNAIGDSIIAQNAGATLITVTGTFNATVGIQIAGVSINTAGTLTNVAYLDAANYFTNTSGQRFKAGIALDDAVPSTHGIIIPSATPGSLINAFYNNGGVITWTGGGGNFAGTVTATLFSGSGASLTNVNATTITVTNDVSATSFKMAFSNGPGASTVFSNAGLTYQPSTGTLAASLFSGSGASLTAVPAGQLTGTITSSVQDNITRTSTLVSGATGAGFTVALGTSTITGTLGVANGGTGLATLTANRIPYGNGTSAFNSSANLTFDGGTLNVVGQESLTFSASNVDTFYSIDGATGFAAAFRLKQGGVNKWGIGLRVGLANDSVQFFNYTNSLTRMSLTEAGALDVTSTVTAASFIPTSSTIPTNGLYLSAANRPSIAVNTTERMRFWPSGAISIGGTTDLTTPGAVWMEAGFLANAGSTIIGGLGMNVGAGSFSVAGLGASGAGDLFLCIDSGSPNVVAQGATCLGSAARFKEHVEDLTDATSTVMKLRPVAFDWLTPRYGIGTHDISLIADEVAKVDRRLAVYQDGEIYSVNDRALLALALQAIREQHAEIQALKAQVR